MKKYRLAVTNIYRKVVSVEVLTERDAHQRAWDARIGLDGAHEE